MVVQTSLLHLFFFCVCSQTIENQFLVLVLNLFAGKLLRWLNSIIIHSFIHSLEHIKRHIFSSVMNFSWLCTSLFGTHKHVATLNKNYISDFEMKVKYLELFSFLYVYLAVVMPLYNATFFFLETVTKAQNKTKKTSNRSTQMQLPLYW